MPRRRGEIVCAVDFGAREVRVLIARQSGDSGIQIIGHGAEPAQGCISQGVIQDLAAAQRAFNRAMHAAEKTAGVKVQSVFCGINGKNVETFIREGQVKLERGIVELSHLEEALDQASRDILAPGKRVVSSITSQEWYVDEMRVRDPIDLRGSVLKARVHFARLPSVIEDNLVTCIESQGKEIEDLVFLPLAAGIGCLTSEDMHSGVAVLDMGRSTTGIVVYSDHRILGTNSFEWGGFHITSDVAGGLSVSFDEADELILEYGVPERLIREAADEEDSDDAATDTADSKKEETDRSAHIKLKSVARGARTIVDREELEEIIFSRSNELMTKVRQYLHARGLSKYLVRGIVLTGGAARIPNLLQLAEAMFPPSRARVGLPECIETMPQAVDAPEYAPLIGVVRHGFEYRAAAKSGRIETNRGFLGWLAAGFVTFMGRYFF